MKIQEIHIPIYCPEVQKLYNIDDVVVILG